MTLWVICVAAMSTALSAIAPIATELLREGNRRKGPLTEVGEVNYSETASDHSGAKIVHASELLAIILFSIRRFRKALRLRSLQVVPLVQ